jgi:hypothetical protein
LEISKNILKNLKKYLKISKIFKISRENDMSTLFKIVSKISKFYRSIIKSIDRICGCSISIDRISHDRFFFDMIRSIDYKVDRSICLSRFFTWHEQLWTLEMTKSPLMYFRSNSGVWTRFQLSPKNKTKHKTTTKRYIYNTN